MKIKTMNSQDKKRISQFAEDIGKSFTKELLEYYLKFIEIIAKEANKK